MDYQIEISRNNVTLAQFLAAVRYECKKKGIDCGIDKDEFENPTVTYNRHYITQDGKKICWDNNWCTEWPIEDAPAQAETTRTLPLDYQIYIKSWDGSIYNLICEFAYDTEKTGHGYYYQLNKA